MTDADIANLALQHIGVSHYLTSLNEDTTQAEACNIAFAHCRRLVLASFPWPFAERFTSLAELSTGQRTDYEYVYTVPSDALLLGDIWTGSRIAGTGRTEFKVAANAAGNGRVFYTDVSEDLEVRYRADLPASMFPPHVAEVLSWRLAVQIAMPITKDANKRAAAWQGYQQAHAHAAGLALSEGHAETPEPEAIAVRR